MGEVVVPQSSGGRRPLFLSLFRYDFVVVLLLFCSIMTMKSPQLKLIFHKIVCDQWGNTMA